MKSPYAIVTECDYPSMPPSCLHIFTLGGAVLHRDLTNEYSVCHSFPVESGLSQGILVLLFRNWAVKRFHYEGLQGFQNLV